MKFISKETCRTTSNSLLTTILLATFLVSSTTSAETPSQCKGLENNACVTANSCSWVEGYERKDGRKVNAFCRTKAKSKSTTVVPTRVNDKTS